MTAEARFGGIQPSQGPPLAIPMSFFLTAPVSLLVAGVLLTATGPRALATGWAPLTLILTHLGTLGFLGVVMLGALYQMTAVVAASPVPAVRLGHGVHALWVAGLALLLVGLGRSSPGAVLASLVALGIALVAFVGPVGWALIRSPRRSEIVTGMTLAVGSLFLVGALGVWMAHGWGGLAFPGPRGLWIQVHLCVGLLGWVGGLITAVSWQVVPMFYLAPPISQASRRTSLALLALGVLAPVSVLALQRAGLLAGTAEPVLRAWALAGALPAGLIAWALHPALLLRSLSRRRRRQADASLTFWRTGLALAPASGAIALAASFLDAPRWGLLLGWIAIWGWAGTIVHGMLGRIVPFLVWFHRFSPLVGHAPVPSMRDLLPEAWARRGLALHAASLAAGAFAILTGSTLLSHVTGLLLTATAVQFGACLAHVLRQRPRPKAAPRPG